MKALEEIMTELPAERRKKIVKRTAALVAAEGVTLSERDRLLVLDLLKSPPRPNAKLRAAIAAMPKTNR